MQIAMEESARVNADMHKSDLVLVYELANVHGLYVKFREGPVIGPSHARVFHMELRVGGLVGFGSGSTKQKAKSCAATEVMEGLKKFPVPEGVTPYWCKPPEKPDHCPCGDPDDKEAKAGGVPARVDAVWDLMCGGERGTEDLPTPSRQSAKAAVAQRMLVLMGFKELMEKHNAPRDAPVGGVSGAGGAQERGPGAGTEATRETHLSETTGVSEGPAESLTAAFGLPPPLSCSLREDSVPSGYSGPTLPGHGDGPKTAPESPQAPGYGPRGGAVFRLRELERRVAVPEDTELTDKELKAAGRAAALSLLWGKDSKHNLLLRSDRDLLETTVKHLTMHLHSSRAGPASSHQSHDL